jgi:hypothetical protein
LASLKIFGQAFLKAWKRKRKKQKNKNYEKIFGGPCGVVVHLSSTGG